MQAAKRTPVDLKEWACGLMDRDNRKSHLAPQLSPATQELLRGSDSPTQTPTQGEIPVIVLTSSTHDSFGSSSDGSPVCERPSSIGGAGRPSVHPGLGSRVSSTGFVPRLGQPRRDDNRDGPRDSEYLNPPSRSSRTAREASAPNFSLSLRSCPPCARPSPPPHPRPSDPERRSVACVTGEVYRGGHGRETAGNMSTRKGSF